MDFQELQELKEAIIHYRKKYWEGNSEVSDSYYDSLMVKLYDIDPLDELLIRPESSNEIINKVYHPSPLLSLEKKYSFDDVKKWMESVSRNIGEKFIFMPKYDGIASVYYADVKTLASRGTGTYGENLTIKLPLIENINWDNVDNTIYGEIIISQDDFNLCSLLKRNSTKYKSPRNLVAGIMNLKNIDSALGKVKLTFIKYSSYKWEYYLSEFNEYHFNEVLKKIKELKYPTDGLVIKLADEEYGLSLGYTEHHHKHSIAYKEQDKEYETSIIDIILQHGKNKLTPVALVKPVNINGVTITRASLHNAKNILDNNICIGDIAYIIRSNDVIPYITKTLEGPIEIRKSPIIDHCHICGGELDYIEPELYCKNEECSGNLIKQLLESCRSLGIENIGQPTIEKMVSQLNVEDTMDILSLSIDELLTLEGFAEQSAKKLYENIHKVLKACEDWKVLSSLNIKGISKGIFKDILNKINTQELLNTKPTDLMGFNNLGYERAFAIYNGLHFRIKVIEDLFSIINVIETKKSIGFTIKPKVCFSGTFKYPKDYYKKIATEKGYEVVEDVSKDVTYLVTAGAMTNKYNKALKYRVTILQADDFLKNVK